MWQCCFGTISEARGGKFWSEALLFRLKLVGAVSSRAIEFREWTPDGHLRHASFAGLRNDKEQEKIVRE